MISFFISMSTSNTKSPTKSIDVRGLYCPEPVFRTKIEMERLAIGNMIKIVADDSDFEDDISMWVKRNGHELLSVNKNNKDLEFLIKKAK